jgi:hypothetical protein
MMLMVKGGNAPPAVKGDAKPGESFPNEPTITAEDAPNAAKLGPLGYVANPQTAWISGEHITVNGHKFHWSGTAWVAGIPAVAALSSIDPSSAPAGSGDTEVCVFGSGFNDAAGATFGGHDVDFTRVSDTELRVTVPAALLTAVGNRQLRVGSSYKLFSITEPTPGGSGDGGGAS